MWHGPLKTRAAGADLIQPVGGDATDLGDRLEDLLEALALGGIVERRRAGWRLAKPLGEVTYADLWQAAQPGGGAPSVEDWAACAQPLGEAARSMQDALSRPVAPG